MPKNSNSLSYRKHTIQAGLLRKFLASFLYVLLSPVFYGHAADTSLRTPESWRPPQIDIDSARRIASTLQKMRRNFVLENTRGAREVAIYQQAAPSVVFIETSDAFGSGVVINQNGHLLTNSHVVGNRPKVTIFLKPKNSADLQNTLQYSALVEKIDEVSDLALLRIAVPTKTIPSLPIGDAGSLAIGQDVHAIGHPKGEAWTYTKGIISQLWGNYEWKTDKGVLHRAHVIQTQTPINPGNSGGPLLDDGARLIGINSFIKSGFQGLNYAVSADTIKEFLSRGGSRVTPTARGAAQTGVYETTRATTVHESPSASSRVIAQINKGTRINVVSSTDDWLEVRSTRGNPPGYVPAGDATYVQSQTSGSGESKCPERYDSARRGWNDIVGCYQDAVGPPPDVWHVYRARNQLAYIAMDSDTSGKSGKIDLFEKNLDPDWKTTEVYADTDCDGFVDVIQVYNADGANISSRLPPPKLRMTSLVKEFDSALKKGIIPHRNLRVCQ